MKAAPTARKTPAKRAVSTPRRSRKSETPMPSESTMPEAHDDEEHHTGSEN
jgi:hypothetical protein